jgi:hypothetical protein
MEVGSTYLLVAVLGRCDDSGEQVWRWAVPTRLCRVGVMTVGDRNGGGQYLPTSGCAG